MGKVFYFGDAWAAHASRVAEQGVVRDGVENMPRDTEVVNGKARVRVPDSAIGLDSSEVHFKGDRCVVEAELPDPRTGDITQVIHRYGDDGKFLESREVYWSKTGNRQHTLRGSRRIFY